MKGVGVAGALAGIACVWGCATVEIRRDDGSSGPDEPDDPPIDTPEDPEDPIEPTDQITHCGSIELGGGAWPEALVLAEDRVYALARMLQRAGDEAAYRVQRFGLTDGASATLADGVIAFPAGKPELEFYAGHLYFVRIGEISRLSVAGGAIETVLDALEQHQQPSAVAIHADGFYWRAEQPHGHSHFLARATLEGQLDNFAPFLASWSEPWLDADRVIYLINITSGVGYTDVYAKSVDDGDPIHLGALGELRGDLIGVHDGWIYVVGEGAADERKVVRLPSAGGEVEELFSTDLSYAGFLDDAVLATRTSGDSASLTTTFHRLELEADGVSEVVYTGPQGYELISTRVSPTHIALGFRENVADAAQARGRIELLCRQASVDQP